MKTRTHAASSCCQIMQLGGQPLLLLMRLVLGGILIFSSLTKLTSGTDFVGVVSSYGMLPDVLAEIFGTVLPWTELLVGVSLVLGLFTRLAASAALLLVVSFTVANVHALLSDAYRSGADLCGCMGSALPLDHKGALAMDAAMLILAVPLIVFSTRLLTLGSRLSLGIGSLSRRTLAHSPAAQAVMVLVAMLVVLPSPLVLSNQGAFAATEGTSTQSIIDSALEDDQPVFLFAYLDTCSYCQKQKPVIDSLEAEFGNSIAFVRVRATDEPEIVSTFGFDGFPAMALIAGVDANGEYLYRSFVGYTSQETLRLALEDVVSGAYSALDMAIDNSLEKGEPVFLFFYADWCHFCQQQHPIIDELETEYGDSIRFLRFENSQHPEEMTEWGVASFPTMFLVVGKVGDSYMYQKFGGFTEKDVLAASFKQVIETGTLPADMLQTGYVHHSCSLGTCYANCIAEKFEFPSMMDVDRFLTDAALDCLGANAGDAFKNAYENAKTGECAYACATADDAREYGDCAQCIIGETVGKIPAASCVVTLWSTLGDVLEPHADCLAECAAPDNTWEQNWGHQCHGSVSTSRCVGANVMESVECQDCEFVVTKVHTCGGGCETTGTGATCKGACNETDCEDNDDCTIDWCNSEGECQHERKLECCPTSCDDHNECTTDTCDGSGSCQHAKKSFCCPGGCSDGDHCTQDWCGENGCEHAHIPGCDKPDDNYDVSTPEVGDLPVMTADARIAVLQSGFAVNTLQTIVDSGFEATLIDESLRGIEKHSVLIIPSGGLSGLDSSLLFRSRLERYVSDGGLLIVFAQQGEAEFEVLPGGEVRGLGWNGDQSCHRHSVGMTTYHPMFSGQTELVFDLNVDGFFLAYPSDTEMLLTRTKNGTPAMIKYSYGRGTVLATTSYDDMSAAMYQLPPDGRRFLHDLYAWATSQNGIQTYGVYDEAIVSVPVTNPGYAVDASAPQYHAGDLVELTFDVVNASENMTAGTVVFQVSDPSFMLTAVTVPASIAPGGSAPVTLSFQLPDDAASGVWTVLYFLQSGDEFIHAGIAGKFTVDHDVASLSSLQAYVTVKNPRGEIVIDTTYPLTVPPGQVGNLDVLIPYTGTPKPGIWSVRYSIIWGDGQVLKSSEHRFAMSLFSETTDGWVYQGGDLLFYITTPDENPPYFSDVTFTVHAVSHGDTDRHIHALYFADNETVQDWAFWKCSMYEPGEEVPSYCRWQEMTVPAGGEAYFSYTHNVWRLAGSAFDVYFWDDLGNQLGYVIRGVQPYFQIVYAGVRTDKDIYFAGEAVPVTIILKTPIARDFDVTGTLTLVSALDEDTILESQTFQTHLEGRTGPVELAMTLAPPDSPGMYIVKLATNTYDFTRPSGGTAAFKVTHAYTLTAGFDHDDATYRAGDPASLNVMVRNDGEVAAALEAAVSCPALGIDDIATLLLWPGDNTTLTYNGTVPVDILPGRYPATVTLTSGTTSDVHETYFLVPQSQIDLALDADSYTAGGEVTLNATNSGGLPTSGQCSLKLVGKDGPVEGLLDLPQGGSATLSLPVPVNVPAGTYQVVASCVNTTTSVVTSLSEPVYIEGSNLELSLDVTEYDAGDGVSVTLANTGGIDATGECSIVLKDPRGFIAYQDSRTESVVGYGSVALGFAIPVQAASGTYRAQVTCTDTGNDKVAWLNKKITVHGTGASLTSITDRTIYLDSDDILMQTGIANSDAALLDGILNLQIWQAVSDEGGVTQDWLARYDGTAEIYDSAVDMAVDGDGNVYVTGYTDGGTSSYDWATAKYSTEGVLLWVAVYNGEDSGYDTPTALVVDSAGNVYVTGTIQKLRNGSTTQMQTDCAVVKYNSSGQQQWVATYDGPTNNEDAVNDIATDPAGNVVITGYSFGFSQGTDLITVEYSPDGTQLWAMTYTSAGYGQEGGNALAIDGDGNVYVTGYSYYNYSTDYTTIKYDSAGIQQWIAWYDSGSQGFDEATSIAVDDSGHVYVAGKGYPSCIVKYDAYGNQQWALPFEGHEAKALATDAGGNVFVTGTIVRGSGGEFAYYDFLTVKYDTDGNLQWASQGSFGADTNNVPVGLALDADGDVYVTGTSMDSSYVYSMATVKYDSDGGAEVWRILYADPSSGGDSAVAIAVDEDANVYVAGSSGADWIAIKYVQQGAGAGELVWETDIPISLAASEIRDIDTLVSIPAELAGLTGKMYHVALLENSSGQVVAATEPYFFYITEGELAMTLETDKPFYRPCETVSITGSIVNSSTLPQSGTLEITKDGAVIHTAPYAVAAGGTYYFSASTNATNTFLLQAASGTVVVSDIIEVVPYGVTLDIIAPDIAGLAPFGVDIILENSSEMDYAIVVSLGDDTWSLELPAGEYRVLTATRTITADTLLTVTVSGDVIMTGEKLVLMGESATLTVSPDPTYLPGQVEVSFSVQNTGLLDIEFEASFDIGGQTVTQSVFVPAGTTVESSVTFDLASGVHSLAYDSPYGSGTVEITVFGEPEFIVTGLPENTDLIAGDPTWVFKIKNVGGAAGLVDLTLRVPDWEDRQFGWLEAGEEGELTFTFVIPDDLEEKTYKAEYELNGVRGEFNFFVHGAKVSVDASLDKNLYEAGETAVLTLNVTNTGASDLDLSARVQLGDYGTAETFALTVGGSTTLQFNVPVDFDSGKLFFGIYLASGRALYLNALYVHEKQALALWTDQQVYDVGDTVTIYVEPPYDGTLDITGPGYMEQVSLTGPATLQFTLPALVTGTYYIEYAFDGTVSRYPIDVRGYSVRITDFSLDEGEYGSGSPMHIALEAQVSPAVDVTVTCQITDFWDDVVGEFEFGASLAAGENDLTADWVFSTTSGGMHTVVCRMYAEVSGQTLMLASARQGFDAIGINETPLPDAGVYYHVAEGNTINFDAGNSYDLNNDALQYRWDFDNDGTWDTEWSSSPTANHRWTDDYRGEVRLEVSDGELSAIDTVGVRVDNEDPIVDSGPDDAVAEGEDFSGSGSFTDPGSDAWTATVDHGDGSGVQPLTLVDKTFNLSHTYTNSGDYTVTVVVTDDDGASGSDTIAIAVSDETFTITATAGTGGTIAPFGDVSVDYGDDQAFAITPETGYRIADVVVDGASVGTLNSYEFPDVTMNHTIEAVFAIDSGTVSGTVTDAVSGAPVPMIFVSVYDLGINFVAVDVTDPTGYYAIENLEAGRYLVRFEVGSTEYKEEWYHNAPWFDSAQEILVTSGGTTTVNEDLVPWARIGGTVADAFSGNPVSGIMVEVRDLTNTLKGQGTTDVDGRYTVGHLDSGTYKVFFYDDSQTYAHEWYHDAPVFESATTVDVTVGEVTVNEDLWVGSTIRGTVTDASTGNPIPGGISVWVFDLDQAFAGFALVNGGQYEVQALRPGSYRIYFQDDLGTTYISEWYHDAAGYASFDDATLVALTTPGETVTVDEDLETLVNTVTASVLGGHGWVDPTAQTVEHGLSATIHIYPDTGYHIASISDNGVDVPVASPYVIPSVNRSHTVVVTFAPDTFTIVVTAEPTEGGSVSGGGLYSYGQTVNLLATANAGYHFVNWAEDGEEVSTDAAYSFAATANRTLVANFAIDTYNIAVTADPTEGGSVSGGGAYSYGQTVELSATANANYHFVRWTEDGSQVSTDSSYSFTATANRTLVAHFAIDTFTITAAAGNGGTITPSGAVVVNYGANQAFVITADSGYHIADVLVDGVSIGPEDTYEFMFVTGNHAISATFAGDEHTLAVTISGSGSITIDPDQTVYAHGTEVTLTAVPDPGWVFLGWSGGLSGSTNPVIVTMDSDKTITATFGEVAEIGTVTWVISLNNPSVYGQPVTFVALVLPREWGAGMPTGTVEFRDGDVTLGAGTLNRWGLATFTTSALAVGPHSITAVYNGNSTFNGSVSPVMVQRVNKARTSVSLTSSVNPSVSGQSVIFTAVVSAREPASGTPTGTVTFKDGWRTLGTAVVDGAGQASYSIGTLSPGFHFITAVYNGDEDYGGSSSSVLVQTVKWV